MSSPINKVDDKKVDEKKDKKSGSEATGDRDKHYFPKIEPVDDPCPTCWEPLDKAAIEVAQRKPGEALVAQSNILGSTIITNTYTVDHAETMVAITKVEGQLDGGLVSGGKDNMMVGVNVETNSVTIIPSNDPVRAKIIDSKALVATMGQAYEEMLTGKITPGEAKKLKVAQELLLGSLKDVDAEGHLNPAAEQKIVQAYKDLTAEALKDPARSR